MADIEDERRYDFVVVSNRLPVDRVTAHDGTPSWKPSPGGLVTALEPVMRANDGAWVGWTGVADDDQEPFEADGLHLVPVPLSADAVELYYEGFSNDTIWPLYHDVIAQPTYSRTFWEAYVAVNRQFAEAAAERRRRGRRRSGCRTTSCSSCRKMLRELRPDLVIGFFNHIPFPAYGLFSQLPWRREIVEGLLGADLIGFQRRADAGNFLRAVRRALPRADVRTAASSCRPRARAAGRTRPPTSRARSWRGTSRSRSTRAPTSRWSSSRRCGPAPRRSATTSATRRRSCSASTGSTTRRASSTASPPTRSCSPRASSTSTTPCSCRSRAPAASGSRPTGRCATRSS